MARSRNIKPSFFTNDELAECSTLARLLFIGLWTIADREGRLEDRPKKIKAEVLPYDDCDCDDLLKQLAKFRFIQRYAVGENKYIQILNFAKHQNPHQKEQAGTIPAPDMSGASNNPDNDEPGLNPLTDSLIPLTDSFTPITPPEGMDEDFESLWIAWKPFDMDKGVKKKAKESYTKARKRGIDHETIIAGCRNYLEYCHRAEQRTKHVVSWLNQDGWEFEAPERTGSKTDPAKQKPAYSATVITAAERARQQLRVQEGGWGNEADSDAGFNAGGNGISRALPPPGKPGEDHILLGASGHAQADGWE